jgi:hypothetical protein
MKVSAPEYPQFLAYLKATIRERQYQALRAVNWLVVSSKNTALAEQLPQAFRGSRSQLVTLMCFATWSCQI